MAPLRYLLPSLLALLLAGCSGSSSGGDTSSNTASPTSPGGNTGTPVGNTGNGGGSQPGPTTTPYGSATNQAQYLTALAAIANAPAIDPFELTPASLSIYNDLIERNWNHLLPDVEDMLETQLQSFVGQSFSGLSIGSISNLQLDFDETPGVAVTNATPHATEVELRLPAQADWSASVRVQVAGTVNLTISGIPTQIPVAPMDIDLTISDLAIVAPVVLDLTGQVPLLSNAGTPSVNFNLSLASTSPIAGPLTSLLTQILQPVLQTAFLAAPVLLQQQINVMLPSVFPQGQSWGSGATAVQPVPQAQPLKPLADAISDEIQANHMPFDHVFPAVFDTPNQGGSVDHHHDHGDSAIWTGHYLAGEAYRYDLTGDTRALTGATRAVAGLELLLDVANNGGGLLSRCAVPMSSPDIAQMQGSSNYFVGSVGGQPWGAKGNISRDQYLGVGLGLGQAYHRIPSLRPEVGPLIERIVGYLEANDWIATQADGVTFSTTFAQAPAMILSFTGLAAMVDPGTWDALHQQYSPLADIIWLPGWLSSQDPHFQYYKFNLSHSNLVILAELETDPDRYRGYLKLMRTMRAAVGHHQNAWFDGIYAMVMPSLAATLGPQVKNELDHWALRPRRGFSIANSQDPTISQTVWMPTTASIPGVGNVVGGQSPVSYATYPVAIEKRPQTDYLWQRNPFDLDGGSDPKAQWPGIDLLLPYWFARNHGFFN